MALLEKIVAGIEKSDQVASVKGAYENFMKADSAADRVALFGQLIAEVAVGAVAYTSARVAFSTARLGLAVSGKIDQWDALSKLVGIGSSLTAGKLIDTINDLQIGGKIYDLTHPNRDQLIFPINPPTSAMPPPQHTVSDGRGNSVQMKNEANGSEKSITWQAANGLSGVQSLKSVDGQTRLLNMQMTDSAAQGGTLSSFVNLQADGSFLNRQLVETDVSGRANAFLAGENLHFSIANATVTIDGNSSAHITGGGNAIIAEGAGVRSSVDGANNSVLSKIAGNTFTLSGKNLAYAGSGDAVWFRSDAAGHVFGNNNTVVADGRNVQTHVEGSGTHVVSHSAGNTFTLNGDRQSVSSSGGNIWFTQGADGNVWGSGNTVVANGANVELRVYGSDTNAISEFRGNTFTLYGERQYVTSDHGNIWFSPGGDGAVFGNRNTIVANGGDIQLNLSGPDTRVVSAFAGNTFTMTGPRVVADVTACNVWLTSQTVGTVYGSNNLVVENGNGIMVMARGDNVTVVSQGENNMMNLGGRNFTVKADNDLIWMTDGADVKIYGFGNTVKGEGNYKVTWMDEIHRNPVPVPNSGSTRPYRSPESPLEETEWEDLSPAPGLDLSNPKGHLIDSAYFY